MNAEPFLLSPNPDFIAILSEEFPHRKTVSSWLPNGNIREEVFAGTNFMEDVLRVYQTHRDDLFFKEIRDSRHQMWQQPYVDEVIDFLRTNELDPALVDDFWLLRCRTNFLFVDAVWDERNRQGHESDQTKRINFINNHVFPFIESLRPSDTNERIYSVTFKTNQPGIKPLKLTGHLAKNMYGMLQDMAHFFIKANEHHKPDLLTNRLKAGIGNITKGSYQTLRRYGVFKPSPQNRPNSDELIILENLIDLAANTEGVISRMAPNSSTTEYLRKFFY